MRLLRTGRRGFVRGLAVISCLTLLQASASASVMRFMSIQELARESSQVVRARIIGQSVHWTPNHEGIYTEIRALALGHITGARTTGGRLGDAAGSRHLRIIQAGGTIDGVSLDWTGRPTFRDGEELILFLQSYDPSDASEARLLVVGGKQGRMQVILDPHGKAPVMVKRDLAGVLDAPFVEGEAPKGPAPRRDMMKLEELSAQVLAAHGGAR